MESQRDSDHDQGLRLNDYWTSAVRRRWWVLSAFSIVGFLGLAVAEKWPLLYRSEALILADQQKVSEQFVLPNVISSQAAKFSRVKQEMLSNRALERMVGEISDDEGARKDIQGAIEAKRNRIKMELVPTVGQPGDSIAVQISYASPSRQLAQKGAEWLTSSFINESLRISAEHSQSTTEFLESELEPARRKWVAQEGALREYKLRFSRQLPAQQQGNVQILSTLQTQLLAKTAELERAEQQQVYLESMRSQYRVLANSTTAQDSQAPGPETPVPPNPADAVIEDLRQQLLTLRARYTPDHPDVTNIEAAIKAWEARKQQTAAAKPQPAKVASGAPKQDVATVMGEMEVASRLQAVALEISNLRKDTDDLRTRVAQYESRLELAPATEQRLSELQQAQEDARIQYESLLQKKLQSEIATNLEKRQQGDRFRIAEPANLPRQPVGKRKIIILGWALGIIAGMGVAALREMTDGTVHGEPEVTAYTAIPVLASIPLVLSPSAKRREHWRSGFEAAAAVALVLVAIVASGHSYFGL